MINESRVYVRSNDDIILVISIIEDIFPGGSSILLGPVINQYLQWGTPCLTLSDPIVCEKQVWFITELQYSQIKLTRIMCFCHKEINYFIMREAVVKMSMCIQTGSGCSLHHSSKKSGSRKVFNKYTFIT